MRTDASVKFKQLLNKYNLYNDFRSRIKHLGLKYESYVTYVEAIYAFRRIINVYDDSNFAKAAVEWEDMVVLNHFSKTIEKYVEQHGMQKVIKVIHELQRQHKWTVPVGIDNLQSFKDKTDMKNTLDSAVVEPKEEPKNIGYSCTIDGKPQKVILPSTPTHVDSSTSAVTPPKPSNPMTPVTIPQVDTKAPASPDTFSFVDSDDGQYDILDLSNGRVGARKELDNYHIRVTSYAANHRVTFNAHITELVRKTGAYNLHLRVDKVLGKTFIAFSVAGLPTSISVKWTDKKQTSLFVNSKTLSQFLSKGRAETKFLRHVSTNLSRRDDMLCFELFDD